MPSALSRGLRTGLCALLVVVALGGAAGVAEASPVFELDHDLLVDGPITGHLLATLVAVQVLRNRIGPSSCRWCRGNRLDDSIRRAWRWADTGLPDTLSNYTGFIALPALTLGCNALAAFLAGRPGAAAIDTLIVAQATFATVVFTAVVKLLVARQRPFVRDLSPVEQGATNDPGENNVSFFSGHSSLGFALAVSAGTVASLRGYRWAPLVWAVGLPLATFTAYLRIAADRHYFTDVLVGSLVGGLAGFAIPYFFHGRRRVERPVRLAVTPVPGGATLGLSGRW